MKIQKKYLKIALAMALVLSPSAGLCEEPLQSQELISFTPFNEKTNDQLDSIITNRVKIEELFYNKHLDTEYSPILLEASVYEPFEVDLETILAKAVQNNINLNIAKADTKAAKWRFWQKIADALPDLSLRASTRKQDGTVYFNSRIQAEVDERISSTSFRVDYRLFDGGTTSFLAWAERFYRDAVKEQEKSQYNLTLVDSVQYYYELIKNHASLAAKVKAFERAKLDMDLAKKYLVAGTGTKFDLIQAEARLARTQQELIDQEANFRNSQINLAEHLNMPLQTPFVIKEDKVQEMSIIDDSMDMKSFITTAFAKNPSIISALKAREGAIREGLSKAGDFLPKVDFYVDLGGTGEEFNDLFGMTTVGFDASYDIGEGIGLTPVSEIMESRAKVKKAKLQYIQERQKIEKGLRNSYINYQKSKSLVEAASKELEASREARRLSELRYKNGLEIFKNLVDREADLTEAEINLISSTADYNLAQANLAYNMGVISTDILVKNKKANSSEIGYQPVIPKPKKLIKPVDASPGIHYRTISSDIE